MLFATVLSGWISSPELRPFAKYVQSSGVDIQYFREPSRSSEDEVAPLLQPVQIQAISDLISWSHEAEKLQSVRVALSVSWGHFSFSWVKREAEGLKVIRGFNLAILDVPIIKGDSKIFVTLWAEPQLDEGGDDKGWNNAGLTSRSVSNWERDEHRSGFDFECFQCWIEKQNAGETSILLPDASG
jgi:hypothetical protein